MFSHVSLDKSTYFRKSLRRGIHAWPCLGRSIACEGWYIYVAISCANFGRCNKENGNKENGNKKKIIQDEQALRYEICFAYDADCMISNFTVVDNLVEEAERI